MTTETKLPATLDTLAADINEHHAQAAQHAVKAVEHAKAAGDLLIEAKASVKHGEWLSWLEQNTTVSPRQSQKYMKLAENWDQIKNELGADLTINGAMAVVKRAEVKSQLQFAEENLACPQQLRPVASNDRAVRVLVRNDTNQNCVMIVWGPTDAGLNSAQLIQDVYQQNGRARELHEQAAAMTQEITGLDEQIASLTKQRSKLNDLLEKTKTKAKRAALREVERQHGPAIAATETRDFDCLDETVGKQTRKMSERDAAEFIVQHPDAFQETARGYWGDFNNPAFSCGPPGNCEWTGAGSAEWLAELLGSTQTTEE